MAKWKKKLKKAAKVAVPVLGAMALAKGLGKRKLSKAVQDQDDAGLGVSHFKNYITKKPKVDHFDPNFLLPGSKDGGRIGKKGGGRTGKQFGGGLGRTARRDMRSGYYPSDM